MVCPILTWSKTLSKSSNVSKTNITWEKIEGGMVQKGWLLSLFRVSLIFFIWRKPNQGQNNLQVSEVSKTNMRKITVNWLCLNSQLSFVVSHLQILFNLKHWDLLFKLTPCLYFNLFQWFSCQLLSSQQFHRANSNKTANYVLNKPNHNCTTSDQICNNETHLGTWTIFDLGLVWQAFDMGQLYHSKGMKNNFKWFYRGCQNNITFDGF